MSDPRYGSPRYERNRPETDLSRDVGDNDPTIWTLVILGFLTTMALTWFAVTPPQSTHETAANRAIETTGLSDRTSPQTPID